MVVVETAYSIGIPYKDSELIAELAAVDWALEVDIQG
jgi:hypothetical protein